jgi:D-alanine-D-alanine ligase
MQKIRLGVIYGGPSVEHEIAVISAVQAMHAADEQKYEIIPIYISKQGLWYTGDVLLDMAAYADLPGLLKQCKQVYMKADRGAHHLVAEGKGFFAKPTNIELDVLLPVMHGAHGEDGCLQGFLELLNIPYAGPGVLAAAVGMDKIMMKNVLAANGLPVLDAVWFTADEWFADKSTKMAEIEKKLGYPVIVKPANLGSSVGINKAANSQELEAALDEAAGFSGRLLIEPCLVDMREVNCSVLGYGAKIRASVCEEPLTDNAFLTYQDKYMSGGDSAKGAKSGVKTGGTKQAGSKGGMSSAKRRIPADLPDEVTAEIQRLVQRAFVALDGCGVARIDVMIDRQTDKIYINEINTIPGSLSFYLWQASGLDFAGLIDELVESALWRQRTKEKLTYSYDTNILASFAGVSGAKGAKGGKF